MRTITINIYTIDEHPDKEKCFEWIRNNEYFHGDFEVDELMRTLNKLSKAIGGTVDWSISHAPFGPGEHITFKDYDEELLAELDADKCPLTGCFWDVEVIEALRNDDMGKVLDTLHEAIEGIYSEAWLTEMCEACEYEFYEGGKRV